MADFTLTLSKPLDDFFGRRVDKVILREPRAGHLQKFGEPRLTVYQTDGTGTVYYVDKDVTISAYFGELLTLDGKDPVDGGAEPFVARLTLADGIALRDALFTFFLDARNANAKRKSTS